MAVKPFELLFKSWFAALNNNNGVFLMVTGPVPTQLINPALSGTNLTFSFRTASGQSYTVQQNTNLAMTNWTHYTNITGNGSLYQLVVPVSTKRQQFFRVSEP